MSGHQSLIANIFNPLVHQSKGNRALFEPAQPSYMHQITDTEKIFSKTLCKYLWQKPVPQNPFSPLCTCGSLANFKFRKRWWGWFHLLVVRMTSFPDKEMWGSLGHEIEEQPSCYYLSLLYSSEHMGPYQQVEINCSYNYIISKNLCSFKENNVRFQNNDHTGSRFKSW